MAEVNLQEVDAFDRARAEVMLTGYHMRWAEEALEVLHVEAEYRSPLINPATGAASRTWTLGGKIDVLAQELFGARRKLLIEHKTSSEDVTPGSEYMRRLRMDPQVSQYYDGAAELGVEVEACLYDVLVKPRHRPYQATPEEARKYTQAGKLYANQRERDETAEEFRVRLAGAVAEEPNDYFARAEVVRLNGELDEFRYDTWGTAREIRECELSNRWPRNPDACSRYGRTCEFFDVCTGEASILDDARFRVDVSNPELSQQDGDARILTSSSLKDARACKRLYKLKHIDKYRAVVTSENLKFGSLIHIGLEAWWKARGNERLEAALAAIGC